MTDNRQTSQLSPVSHIRPQVQVEQGNSAWYLEEVRATLTLISILVAIVVVRLITLG